MLIDKTVSDPGSWPNDVLLYLIWQGQCVGRLMEGESHPLSPVLTQILTLSIAHSPFSPLVARPKSGAHPFLTRAAPTELLTVLKPLAGELVVGWVISSEFIFNIKFDSPRTCVNR